jgi:hypothetical protein
MKFVIRIKQSILQTSSQNFFSKAKPILGNSYVVIQNNLIVKNYKLNTNPGEKMRYPSNKINNPVEKYDNNTYNQELSNKNRQRNKKKT